MNEQDYSDQLSRFETCNRDNLAGLANWANAEGLPWLWSELDGMISDRSVKPLESHDAIRKGLQTTHTDREKMPLQSSFYIAQLTMLDSELKGYCRAAGKSGNQESPYAEATTHTLHRALKDHLAYGRILLEQAGHALLDLPGVYGAWSRRREEPFEVYKGAEQIVYGTYSGLTHPDRAPYIPTAVLRTAIEIRFRSAFCIEGYTDSSNNAFVPINLSSLFDAVRERLPKMEFAVDFHDVVKVYKWCNFYLHSGWRDFPWVVGFAVQFLRPIFADPRDMPDGGWSINGGIRMNREEWRAIRSHFERVDQSEGDGLFQALCMILMSPFCAGRRSRHLVLNPAREDAARCVFLN